ncbi:uncharacterized protein LOC144663476 isoform X1 [Oculina patagonica]
MMNLEGKEILQQRSSGWVLVYMDKGSNNLALYQKVPCSIAEMLWCEDRGPEKNAFLLSWIPVYKDKDQMTCCCVNRFLAK